MFALNTALNPHENHESAEINIFWTITFGLDDFEMDTPVGKFNVDIYFLRYHYNI